MYQNVPTSCAKALKKKRNGLQRINAEYDADLVCYAMQYMTVEAAISPSSLVSLRRKVRHVPVLETMRFLATWAAKNHVMGLTFGGRSSLNS